MKHAVIDRPHTVSAYDNQLAEVKSLISTMANLAQRSLDKAIIALEKADQAAAQDIISRDKMIDDLELSLEQLVLLTITSRAPMAGDLRFLIVAIRIAKMLERTGDQGKRIARRVKKLDPAQIGHSLDLIQAMAKYATEMVETAIESLDDPTGKTASEVVRADEKLNAMHKNLVRSCRDAMEQSKQSIDHGIEVISIGKQLERVGDYATNIARDVLYMVNGSRDEA